VHAGRDGELVVRGVPIVRIGEQAQAAGITLHELAPMAGSLEELFLDWTSTEEAAAAGGALAGNDAHADREAVLL
jgi:ABC-2 type transport system ATP-binding protein